MVLLVLYLAAAGITAFALRARGTLIHPDDEDDQSDLVALRFTMAIVSLFLGFVGVVALSDLTGEPGDALYSEALAFAIFASLPTGCLLYVLGLVAWRGQRALAFRVAGACVMALGLLVPSVLTLGLPLLAVLAVTLREIPARTSRDPAPPTFRST